MVSQRLADLERKLADGSRAISSRDALIETLEAAESQQKQRSAQLQVHRGHGCSLSQDLAFEMLRTNVIGEKIIFWKLSTE